VISCLGNNSLFWAEVGTKRQTKKQVIDSYWVDCLSAYRHTGACWRRSLSNPLHP